MQTTIYIANNINANIIAATKGFKAIVGMWLIITVVIADNLIIDK